MRDGGGDAGRGVDRADVIALPGREDADIWAYFASLAFPPERQVRAALATLAEAGRPLSTAALETLAGERFDAQITRNASTSAATHGSGFAEACQHCSSRPTIQANLNEDSRPSCKNAHACM